MKPIKSRTFLVQNSLIVLSVMLAVLGFLLAAKSIPFFPSVQANYNELGDTTIQITQGTMPLSFLALYLSFLCIYLIFEFYGFKPAFYTSINISIVIALCYGISIVLHRFVLDPENSQTDLMLSQVFVIKPRVVLSLFSGVLLGFTTAFVLAAIIKKITRNYFMFIRFPLAASAGFFIFTAVVIYVTNLNLLAPESMMLEALPPLSHFLAMIIASVIPLYLLRLFLGIFRGRLRDDDEHDKDHSLFKGSQPKEIPPAPTPAQAQIPEQNCLTNHWLSQFHFHLWRFQCGS